jgi:oxygen-independent coproporphyrinogen-3 oxidase
MAGIYLHIPFCHTQCSYCDFYKSTQVKFKPGFVQAVLKEIGMRESYLGDEPVETIYFGGGTPSVLLPAEIELILGEIFNRFPVAADAEITFEANPDDLIPAYLKMLASTPVNRLSIGIQSFNDSSLQKMRRRHNSSQAIQCVNDAFDAGFKNLSIDLIYGLPELTLAGWEENVTNAFALPVSHLSAYHLTYHKGTYFYDLLKKGIISEISEDDSLRQFEILLDMAARNRFDHYEISNFALGEKISRHNYGYWFGSKYLGIGPSAHSFDGISRSWNVSDLFSYLKGIGQGQLPLETEYLSKADRYNDLIITRLRTKWGISEEFVSREFGEKYRESLQKTVLKYFESGHILITNGQYTLTRKGYFISDRIMEDLMILEAGRIL